MKQYIFIQAIYRHGETLPEGLGTYLVETEHDGVWLLDTVAEVDRESVVTLIPCKDYGEDTYFRHGLFLYHFDEEKGHLVTVETYVQILGIIDPIAVDPETEEPILPEEDGHYLVKDEAEEITSIIRVYTEEDERKWETETPSKEDVYVFGPKGYVYDEVTGKFSKAPIPIKHLQDVVGYDDVKKEFLRSPMFFPLTHVRAVIDSKGNNVGSLLDRLQDNIDAAIVYLKRYAEAQAKAGVSPDGITIGYNLDEQLQVRDGGISTAKLAGGAVTSDKIAEGAITGDVIGDGAITTEKINNGAVTTEKIAADGVETANIKAGAVTSEKIADTAISTSKIEDKAITKEKIADEVLDPINARINPVFIRADVSIVDVDHPTITLRDAVSQAWMDAIDRGLKLEVTSADGAVLETCLSTDYYSQDDPIITNAWAAFFKFYDYTIRVDRAGNATITKNLVPIVFDKNSTLAEVKAAYDAGKQLFFRDEYGKALYSLTSTSAAKDVFYFTLTSSDGVTQTYILKSTGWSGENFSAASQEDVEEIEVLIPEEASTTNKLADKDYVLDKIPLIVEYDSGTGDAFKTKILTALGENRPIFLQYGEGLYAMDGFFNDDQDTRITFLGDYQDKSYEWMWSLRFDWSTNELAAIAREDSFRVTKYDDYAKVAEMVVKGLPIYFQPSTSAGGEWTVLHYVGVIDDKYTFTRTYFDEDGTAYEESVTIGPENEWEMKKEPLGGSEPLKKVTYSELKTLRDGGKLIPGQQYRITDYHCTTAQENTRSADHQFDIIVIADDEKTLNENARAIQHEGDTYFADCNLAAWELKYCLDNDTSRFAWADSHGAGYLYEGVIFEDSGRDITIEGEVYHIYEYGKESIDIDGNEAIGKKGDVFYLVFNDYGEILLDEEIPADEVEWVEAVEGTGGVIYYMKDEWNNECPYDFKNIQFKRAWNQDTNLWSDIYWDGDALFAYTFSSEADHDTTEVEDTSISGSSGVCSNRIAEYREDGCISANNNVFFGNGCSYNTFEGQCFENTLGKNCSNNIFRGGPIIDWVLEACFDVVLGNECNNNNFGNGFQQSSFGEGCSNNLIENSCTGISFGNGCCFNKLGIGCAIIRLGNECCYNIFESNCVTVRFGEPDTLDYCHNNIIGSEAMYLTIYATTTPTSSNYLQNIRIARGVTGYPHIPLSISVAPGLEYETYVGKNSSGALVMKNLLD